MLDAIERKTVTDLRFEEVRYLETASSILGLAGSRQDTFGLFLEVVNHESGTIHACFVRTDVVCK